MNAYEQGYVAGQESTQGQAPLVPNFDYAGAKEDWLDGWVLGYYARWIA